VKTAGKEKISQHTRQKYMFLRISAGLKELMRKKYKFFYLVIYTVLVVRIWNGRFDFSPIDGTAPLWNLYQKTISAFVILLTFIGLIYFFVLVGKPIRTKALQENLLRIGFVNRAGEHPILISKYKDKKENATVMKFENRGIDIAEWDKRYAELQTALNCYIARIEYGKNLRYILLYTISARHTKARPLYWSDKYLRQESFVLILGKGLTGEETVNLTKTPHILLGGSTGSGKSMLLKLLIMQCIKKGAVAYIADFKGGVDFQPVWHEKCKLVFREEELLEVLTNIVIILQERKDIFRESGCANIDEYNAVTKSDLQRIIFACDEVAEVLDKTGLGKEDKELILQIESKLSVIARQGRAFGIHMILATQRPDSQIISGQIKNNMDFRVCGRADKVLSQIILDNSDAADKIAKEVQGKFLTNTGAIFQGYLFDERRVF
jgi:DNA segregation ATPase FtsK/SpoIIIE and related proteins